MIVAAWELLVWLPADLVASFNGFEVPRAVALMTIHVIIGASGMVLLRRTPGGIDNSRGKYAEPAKLSQL